MAARLRGHPFSASRVFAPNIVTMSILCTSVGLMAFPEAVGHMLCAHAQHEVLWHANRYAI